MIYYTVGTVIEDLTNSWFSGITARSITATELSKSLMQQNTLRLFTNLEEAKYYAKSLRRFTQYPKNPLSHNKVAPIFTIEIDEKAKLGNPLIQFITYDNGINQYHTRITCEQKISFYEIKPQQIKKVHQAEFVDSPLAPINFNQIQSPTCTFI